MSPNGVVWFFNRIVWAVLPQLFDTCIKHMYTLKDDGLYYAREDIQNLKGTFEKKYEVRSLAPLSASITQKVAMLWSDASKG